METVGLIADSNEKAIPEELNTAADSTKTPPLKLSREQRRIIDRVEQDATKTYNQVVTRFNQFLVESENITPEIVEEKIALLDKQWRFYCKNHGISEKARGVVADYCRKAFEGFNEVKP